MSTARPPQLTIGVVPDKSTRVDLLTATFLIPLVGTQDVAVVQVSPLPEKPALQVQVNEPAVSMHVALKLQLCVPSVHSFMLVQLVPSPTKPALQVQANEPAESAHVALAWQSLLPTRHSF